MFGAHATPEIALGPGSMLPRRGVSILDSGKLIERNVEAIVSKLPLHIAEREADRNRDLFEVRFVPLQSEQRSETIRIRGRTMADAVVLPTPPLPANAIVVVI